MIFAITGGGGYTGFHIGWKLKEGGHEVRLVDIRSPNPLWNQTASVALFDALPQDYWTESRKGLSGDISFHKTNILNKEDLKHAFRGADAIIHTASYGVSGQEQLSPYYDIQEDVNLTGTLNVLEAASESMVKCVVFTSTYNVVFGGKEIFGGDEKLDRFPLHRHVDHYSRTKSVAEMVVLASNGKALRGDDGQLVGTLRTCALRLNGIMGLGESRHMDRIISVLRSGMFVATYGDKNALVDFVGIQNVVQAHIRAVFQLMREQKTDAKSHDLKSIAGPSEAPTTSGNAFFISDESPVNNFEFFRPLIEGLGHQFPSVNVPFPFIMLFAKLQALIYSMIHRHYPFTPFVTPAEAFKTGRTHYFRCGKAVKAFGYCPTRPNDLSQVLDYYKDASIGGQTSPSSAFTNLLLICFIIALIVFASSILL